MASQLFSTFTEVGLVDTRVNAGTIQLPKTIDIPYRQISLKDIYGNFQNKSLTLTTQFPDTFEDGTTTKVLSNAFGFTTLYAGLTNVWYMTGGTTLTSQTVSSLTVSSISGNGSLLTNLPSISSLSLQSTITGLGSAGYVSTTQLTSTVASLVYGYQTAGFVSTATIVSTTQGLQYAYQTSGFVSSPNLIGLTSTTALNTSLTSTVASLVYGYQTAGFVSTATIVSTTSGLQYAYQTAGFVSSPNLLNHVSTTFLNTSLASTVQGLGSAGYMSTATLASTVQGLGSANYISSTQFLSTTRSYGTYFTTLSASFSSIYASNGYISSLRVDALQLGSGDGWADFGPLRATSISTLQVQTGALYTTSNFIGSVSTPYNAIQFYGLFGQYNNTVLAEVSTGVGTQELLFFKGSSTSDRIRLQTTGSIVFEPGSSTRLWASSITSNAVPAMVIDTNSNVGIKTGTTAGIALDVAGFGRFQTVSTLNIQLSSINGLTFGGPINSTVIGLGTTGYISSSQLLSTTAGLAAASGITQATLNSTVQGLGSATYVSTTQLLSTTSGIYTYVTSFIDPTELTSTVVGLGTTGYVSTMGLLSTASGLASYITTFIDPVELASTVTGLGSASFVSTLQLTLNITSTVAGLGSIGYLSTSQLTSTVASVVYGYQTAGFVSTATIVSTTSGLQYAYQTAGFVSTATIQSTTSGLQYAYQTAGFVSSPNLLNNVSTTFLNTSLASTVQGLGTAGYISTASLVSTFSASGGLFASTVRGLGTTGYISTASLTSTVAALGTAVSLLVPYSTLNTASYFQLKTTNTQVYYGNVGSNSQVYMGDILAAYGDPTTSTPLLLMEQLPISSAPITVNYTTPASNSWTAPAGVTSISLTMRGGGGGGGGIFGGANGGLVSGTLAVTPGVTYTIVSAGGGTTYSRTRYVAAAGGFGGGGTGGDGSSSGTTGAGGGGGSYFSNGATLLVAAGGGGGTSESHSSSAGAGGGTTGGDGSAGPGYGGTQSAGGAGFQAGNGSYQQGGGNSGWNTGGGGGGYYGGGGGKGGGGGSSYVANLTGTVVNTQGGGAAGGAVGVSGADGSVSFTYSVPLALPRPGNILEIRNYQANKTIIDPFLNMGINVSSINSTFKLDVNGVIRAITLSTQNIQLSSINGLTFGGPINSTVIGLGSSGYISSSQLLSTAVSYANTFTSLSASFSSVTASNVFASTLIVNNLQIGTGLGWVNIGPIQTVALSTTQLQTGALYATSNFIGSVSTPYNAIQFYGLFGQYNNTVLAEVSTGVGTQELLFFKGSSTSDRIRLQTTGSIVFEPGSSARLWASSITSNVTPAMVIDTNSNVGIKTGTTVGIALDVAGVGRFQTVSTLNIQLSSINGLTFGGPINSTVIGLGSSGYISTATLTSTVIGLGTTGYISTATLTSTVAGLLFTGSSISLSTASLFTSSVQASSISVGNGAWLSNTGLYLSNAQAGGAVGQLITNAGFVKLVAASGWSGGYTGFAITGGDLVNKIYMTAGPNAIGGQIAIGGTSPSPGSGISLDVFGVGRFSSISTFQTVASSIGIGIGQPLTPLDVAGMGRFQQLSTLLFNVSSINGFIPWQPSYLQSTVQGLGTAGYISTASLTSTIVGLGTTGYISTASLTSTIIGLGTTGYISTASLISTTTGLGTASALLVPYSSLNTATYFQLKTSSTQLYYGTFGSTSQVYIGDINSKYGNATLSTPTLLMEQFPIVIPAVASTIGATGADVTYTVPAGVTSLDVVLNGAGGGGGSGSGTLSGGAGGYVSGRLAVTPGETLTIVVGTGGTRPTTYYAPGTGYGGGGSAGGIYGVGDSGGGGGRSAIRRGGVDIVTAGGGGGAEGSRFYAGGLGGGTTGGSGGGFQDGQGLGGTQTAGGAGGQGGNSSSGSLGIGGDASSYGAGYKGAGGGGGGYYGGGSGNSSGSQPGSGGGGSSYVALLTGTVVNTQGGGAAGGTTSLGSNGSVIITIPGYSQTTLGNIIEVRNYLQYKFIIDPSLNVGVNVSSINTNFKLDVNGAIRATSLSTQQIQASSITGNSISTQNIQLSSINGQGYGASLLVPYSTLNTATYFQVKTSSTQLYYGNVGSTAQVYMGDILAAYGNATTTTPLLLMEQVSISLGQVTQTFTYTGADQSFQVPAGVTSMNVILIGGGGGSAIGKGSGGTSGYVSGTLAVTPAQNLTIMVGQGGTSSSGSSSATYGGGGSSSNGGAGGGRSAIILSGSDLVTAGGGGGGNTGSANYYGGAGGGSSGGNGGASAYAGQGATTTGTNSGSGGAGALSGGVAGSQYQGANGITGGGGGYYGGGSGVMGGGGGGSAYVTLLTGTVVNTAGGGVGASVNGSVTLIYTPSPVSRPGNILEIRNYQLNKTIIDPLLNMGINVTSINSSFQLDVNGALRATTLSTQNIQLSSINGLTFGGPINSTVIGLGTAGYISTASLVSTFSASGGLFASTVRGLGTTGYISTASLISTVAALGTASGLLVPYSTLNTATYFNIRNSTNQLFLGTNGPASQVYIGDVKATYGDSVSSEPLVLIQQNIIQQLNIGSSNYSYLYNGQLQYFTPPAGVTSVSVVLNGGGGASAPSYTGGSGGYVSGTLPVTPLTQYTIVIGQGGIAGQNGSWGGGGMAGGASSGGGAGRSAILLSGSDLVTAGGGGGAGAYSGNGGAGGGSTGASGGGTGAGGGGSTSYYANGGANSGGNGGSPAGGSGYTSSSGGGGGGYYGGGGGGNNSGGGGGGSSYVANLTGTVVNTQGGGSSAGVDGSISISWNFPLLYRNANPLEIRGWQGNKVQIDSYLNMSLSVSSPTSSFRLDVNGIGRMGMPVSSITGTVATFGTTSYGIYYYISNSGFSNITLTSVTAFTGWFVTLRNNTTSYLSVAVTGQTNSTPATPFTIAPSNATTIAYDTNYNSGGTAGYAFF